MKKIIYLFTLFSVFVLFNSCDWNKSKKCNDELEATKKELEVSKENNKQLEQKIKGERLNIKNLDPAIGSGTFIKSSGVVTYTLLVPKDFIIEKTTMVDNLILHSIKPKDRNARYTANNDLIPHEFTLTTRQNNIEVLSIIEPDFVKVLDEGDIIIERKHRGSIIIGG